MPEPAVTGRARLPCPRTWTVRRRRGAPVGQAGRGGGGTRGKPAPVTPGQERLILAALEAGLKPAAIARGFRLSRTQVDGVAAAAKQRRR